MSWFRKNKQPIQPWITTTLEQWRSNPELLLYAQDRRFLQLIAVLRNGLPIQDVNSADGMKEYGRCLGHQDVISALELMRQPFPMPVSEPEPDYSEP